MSTWFKGSSNVAVETERIASDLGSYGEHCAAVLQFMPGITSAELLADDGDSITIKTNEGTMHRTAIRRDLSEGRVVLEFDEEYQVGSKMVVSSHHRHAFVSSATGAEQRLVISDVQAPGFLGWLYRRFAARNVGRGLLRSYAQYYSAQESESKTRT